MKYIVLLCALLVGCKDEVAKPDWYTGEWDSGYTNYHLDAPKEEPKQPTVIIHRF